MELVVACVAEHATVQASDGGDVCTKRPFEAHNVFTLHEVLPYVTVMSSVRNLNFLFAGGCLHCRRLCGGTWLSC